ncbi:MAG: hypothetical protein HYS04_15380 [Acidobacteria bacterium]|nr:hypothetical protein [Acidobacteriota bacterium]
MGNINWSRVLLCGLLAGLIINIGEFILNAVVLADDWRQAMTALNRPGEITPGQIVVFNIWGFVGGITLLWLYAAIRPRYGAGPRTALCAGAAFWFIGYAMAMVGPLVMDIFPSRLIFIGLAWGLGEVLVAALVGSRFYQEGEARAPVEARA